MKIRALGRFQNRKPTHEPARAAAASGYGLSAQANAANVTKQTDAASPSQTSMTFTALTTPTIQTIANATSSTWTPVTLGIGPPAATVTPAAANWSTSLGAAPNVTRSSINPITRNRA